MKINDLTVTSNEWVDEVNNIDENSCHLELDGCLRLVHLSDTQFETIEELKTAVMALIFE